MKIPLTKLSGNRRGATAVEFGLVAVPLLLVVFGALTYGGLLATQLLLTQAAQEGARATYAGLDRAEQMILATERVRDALVLDHLRNSPALNVSVEESEAGEIRVRLDFLYRSDPLIPPVLLPLPERITAQATSSP